MKAFWLAFASLVSIVPASAGEIASPLHGARIGETAISRMYRVAWLANLGRQLATIPQAPASNLETAGGTASDRVAEARASVDSRIRAITAEVDDEMRELAAGQPLRYRLRVNCSAKYVEAITSPGQRPAPALIAAFGSDVTSVKVSVETCTVKVYWKRLDREDAPQMRSYSVSLPLDETSD